MTVRPRDGARTKARIETEALRLFAEKGVDGTSVRDIASAVGVAEGALYRHFPGKETLSRSIFLQGYAGLASRILAIGRAGKPFEETVEEVIGAFCSLFDEDRPLFAFLLLTQHTNLHDVPSHPEDNVVEAVRCIFSDAISRGEIPAQDADLLAALALGIVGQPATFTIYGRLEGPLSARRRELTQAVLSVAGARLLRAALQGA
jgi:AcrR family transcriptional regulator